MNSDDPTRNLGFLVHEVARLLRRNFDRRVRSLGLTQAQWRTLAYVARNEGTKQADLAELLEVRPITLARLVDRLEEAGWVERRRDPADRRVCRLHLTEAANPIIAQMEHASAATRADALAGLTRDEQGQVLDLLCRLKRNLLQAEADAAPADSIFEDE
jgi:MarR family transcriptional regulator for hemolysin